MKKFRIAHRKGPKSAVAYMADGDHDQQFTHDPRYALLFAYKERASDLAVMLMKSDRHLILTIEEV